MASQANNLLSPRVLDSNYTQPEHEWIDLGAFRHLGAEVLVLTAGTGADSEKVLIESAAIKDAASFRPVTGLEVKLNTVGVSHVYADEFMRYVRVKVTGTVTGSPVVAVNIIAKE